jgi:hypothetical protein
VLLFLCFLALLWVEPLEALSELDAVGVLANEGADTASAEPAIRTAPRTGTSFLITVDLQVEMRRQGDLLQSDSARRGSPLMRCFFTSVLPPKAYTTARALQELTIQTPASLSLIALQIFHYENFRFEAPAAGTPARIEARRQRPAAAGRIS